MGLLQSFGLTKDANPNNLGSRAPELSLSDEEGNKVDLGDLYKIGPTLVYFYPKALTPVCTTQACHLRDNFETLKKAGVAIVGISRDKVETLKRFKEKHRLPFTLLSDQDGRLCKAFGVPLIFSVSLRQSYLVVDGVIVWRDFHPRPDEQTRLILAALEKQKQQAV